MLLLETRLCVQFELIGVDPHGLGDKLLELGPLIDEVFGTGIIVLGIGRFTVGGGNRSASKSLGDFMEEGMGRYAQAPRELLELEVRGAVLVASFALGDPDRRGVVS